MQLPYPVGTGPDTIIAAKRQSQSDAISGTKGTDVEHGSRSQDPPDVSLQLLEMGETVQMHT